MMKRFIIVDGNAIIHRAYHAIPPLTAKDGTVVNAVYGFTSMLLKVIKDLKPDYMAVSFDVGGGTFRDKIYKEYKATRVKTEQELYDQIPLCYDIVKAFDIPIYTKKGYEADDVIGTVVTQVESLRPELRPKGRKEKVESVIVTGDMDLLQVVDEQTKVYTLRKGMSDVVMYDIDKVKEKYGFGPEFVVDYKALRGDASDNIPGVKGIGEKTATELITKIGGIEKIYQELRTPNSELQTQFSKSVIQKLEDNEENARMSHDLATIRRDAEDLDFKLENCSLPKFDSEKIGALFQKFGFYSLLKRVPGNETDGTTLKPIAHNPKPDKILIVEVDEKNLKELEKTLNNADEFICKEILTGSDILNSELLGLVFVVGGNCYNLSTKIKNWESILSVFNNAKLLIGHDLKKLLKVIFYYSTYETNDKRSINLKSDVLKRDPSSCDGLGITNTLFDTMIASYVLNSSNKNHDAKNIIWRELGINLSGNTNQTNLFGSDLKSVAEELSLLLQVKTKFVNELKKTENLGLFEKIEMPLIPVLAKMEMNGIVVDTKILNQLSIDVAKEIEKVTKKIWNEAGEEFNVASSVQLRDILFDKLKLPSEGIKKGKTGYSTAEPELEKLSGQHPIIDFVREHRELAKLQNTYVDVLPTLINKKTNRIHTTFNQAVTTTGRLSSSEPNLQNIPIRTALGKEIRNTFISEPGNVLIVADYSQIELRIVASLAQDEHMIEIFRQGKDIHQATAAAIHNVPLDQVTKEMRYSAKEVNFGVLYGMGSYGLSWRAKIPQWQAKEFIKKYFENFSGVKKYIDQTLEFAKKEGYVETLFGRRRYIPELQAENFQLKNAGERMAINMPIQGTAADLMKLAMINVNNKIREAKYKEDDVKMILQVHDELVLEVKEEISNDVSKLVKEAMESVGKLRVPIDVHVDIGTRWGELK